MNPEPVDFSDRHEYVGASECSIILGLNPYTSAHELWRRKVDRRAIEPNRAMRLGSFLEPFCIDEYELETGTRVVERQREFASPSRRVRAHIDGKVEGIAKLVEVKTVGEWAYQAWKTAIPDQYRCQVEVQAFLAGVDEVDLAILVGNKEFKIVEVKADRSIGEDIVNRCAEWFAVHVSGNEAPAVTPEEARESWQPVESQIVASREVEESVYDLQIVNSSSRTLADKVVKLRTKIQDYMTTHTQLINSQGVRMVDWTNVVPSRSIEVARLRRELVKTVGLEQAELIIDNSSRDRKPYRRFTIK